MSSSILEKYVGGGDKKKKVKKVKAKKFKGGGMRIVDDEGGFGFGLNKNQGASSDEEETVEELPQIAAVVDERPREVQLLEEWKQGKWRTLEGVSNGEEEVGWKKKGGRTRHDSDQSPPRGRRRHDSDQSPPRGRRRHDSDQSPPRERRRHDSDQSPPRGRRRHDSDQSPPRERRRHDSDQSPPRERRRHDSDQSPPRGRKGLDVDDSPPRRRRRDPDRDLSPSRKGKFPKSETRERAGPSRRTKRGSDSDLSPPRIPRKNASDDDLSPPRKPERRERDDHDLSPPRHRRRGVRDNDFNNTRRAIAAPKVIQERGGSVAGTTLEGKKAGLQKASDLRNEMVDYRKRENEMFATLDDEVSGRNAITKLRDRTTGRERDLALEMAKKEEEERKAEEKKQLYNKWGAGLKQVEERQTRANEALHEISKPLARYADDTDLDEYLKKQDREGDPMLKFLAKKKQGSGPVKPRYQGPPPPPNRFGILPGCRWDGVDRSSGYEKEWFSKANIKKAVQEEAYKWSVSDM